MFQHLFTREAFRWEEGKAMKQTDEKKNRLPIFRKRLWELIGDEQSQTEFAKYIGLSRQTLGFYLNGDRIPDAEGILKICKACNVSSDWLLGIADPDNSSSDEKIRMVSQYTGLSNEAVERLESIKSYRFSPSNILSEIVCNPSFPLLMQRISELKKLTPNNAREAYKQNVIQHLASEIDGSPDPTLNYQSELEIVEHKEFQITKQLMAILQDTERGVHNGGNS